MSNYHKKFDNRKGPFTGRIFTNEEFLEHLTNINFHSQCSVLSKLSAEKLRKVKSLFVFEDCGGGVIGLPWNYSMDDLKKLIESI